MVRECLQRRGHKAPCAKAGIEQVQDGVFCAANVKINRHPCFFDIWVDDRLVILGVENLK